jgi:hypothetical protein
MTRLSNVIEADEQAVRVTIIGNGSIAQPKEHLDRLMAATSDLIHGIFIPKLNKLTQGTSPGISPKTTSYHFQHGTTGNTIFIEIEVNTAQSVDSDLIYKLIIQKIVPSLTALVSTAVVPKPVCSRNDLVDSLIVGLFGSSGDRASANARQINQFRRFEE